MFMTSNELGDGFLYKKKENQEYLIRIINYDKSYNILDIVIKLFLFCIVKDG